MRKDIKMLRKDFIIWTFYLVMSLHSSLDRFPGMVRAVIIHPAKPIMFFNFEDDDAPSIESFYSNMDVKEFNTNQDSMEKTERKVSKAIDGPHLNTESIETSTDKTILVISLSKLPYSNASLDDDTISKTRETQTQSSTKVKLPTTLSSDFALDASDYGANMQFTNVYIEAIVNFIKCIMDTIFGTDELTSNARVNFDDGYLMTEGLSQKRKRDLSMETGSSQTAQANKSDSLNLTVQHSVPSTTDSEALSSTHDNNTESSSEGVNSSLSDLSKTNQSSQKPEAPMSAQNDSKSAYISEMHNEDKEKLQNPKTESSQTTSPSGQLEGRSTGTTSVELHKSNTVQTHDKTTVDVKQEIKIKLNTNELTNLNNAQLGAINDNSLINEKVPKTKEVMHPFNINGKESGSSISLEAPKDESDMNASFSLGTFHIVLIGLIIVIILAAVCGIVVYKFMPRSITRLPSPVAHA